MKKLLTLCAAVALVVSAVYFCPVGYLNSHVANLDAPRNVYERASRSMVLIQTPRSQGSGVTVIRRTEAGNAVIFVWTAAHVVTGVNEVLVIQPIRSQYQKVGKVEVSAHVIVRDEVSDLALLQIDGSPTQYFQSAKFDDILPPPVGTKLFHYGNFFGTLFDGSLSTGVLSQIGVCNTPWPIVDQTDALILPGSSGGPVFRSPGVVVGVAVGSFRGVVNTYVPVRAMSMLVPWAVERKPCPSLAALTEMRSKARVTVLPNVIELLLR